MRNNTHYEDLAAGIAEELRNSITGEVRFDSGSRALYATDSSNYRQVPIGVVIPRDEDDVLQTMEVARRHGAPILARGGGTSLAGQCCNVAILMDFSKYLNRIQSIDPDRHRAVIQPGIVLDRLREAAEEHHLTFGPDPATHTHCTLGGMIGNNSCGVHSVYAGKTDDNVEELEILTYQGARMRVGKTSDKEFDQILRNGGPQAEIYSKLKAFRDRYADQIRKRYPNIPRRVSGYNLIQLLPENDFHVARALVGSECTCVVVLSAVVRLVPSPSFRNLVVLGFHDIATAGDNVMKVLEHKPLALEGLDDRLINAMKRKNLHPKNLLLLPEGDGWLMVEFGGENEKEAEDKARGLMDAMRKEPKPPSMKLFEVEEEEKLIWKIRESGLGATAIVPGEPPTWEGWEDSAVPPDRVGPYLRDLRKLMNKYEYECSLYGHFGQGCIHTRIDFDLFTADGIRKFRSFLEEAADLVISYGGSLSGEHGDGQSRAELLPKMFGKELVEAFGEFKKIWDPDGKMNPGKIVDPYRLDENLRIGTTYNPAKHETHFQFPEDDGNFAKATLRCVGVGECRRIKGGVMCPSYMATMEEKHSTRGRARLLFEMMKGEVLSDGWKNEHVKEALDLCLACKGCKSDCPVQVDMATYKAEFLSHYYEGTLRPRSAYSMGLIYWWSRLGSIAPGLTNFLIQKAPLGSIAKTIAGVSSKRNIPLFAGETFKHWFSKRSQTGKQDQPEVILWPDTFNNHFHPETAKAAVQVLEAYGFRVTVPSKSLCCGRPLYDFGFLSLAKKLLREILETMREDIVKGTPVIVLEPSCLAVFHDELPGLFPRDQNAMRLTKQTFLLSDFLLRQSNQRQLRLEKKAIVQVHCHHRAVVGFDSEHRILKDLGLDFEIVDSGCCGMAGSFGFEKDHYDVSIKTGERVLLPAVRRTPQDALIIANGFSCREQITQSTGRQTWHLAEILQMALENRI